MLSRMAQVGDSQWRAMYEAQIETIDRVIGFVCRRNGLKPDEAEELRSEVHLKIIESDFAILRQFDRRSSITTYLTVAIQRLSLDYRIERWGKWRPSEAARRQGSDAVRLETLMIRDGVEFGEAVELLRTNHGCRASRDELYAMTRTFPIRTGRASHREVGIEQARDPAVPPEPSPGAAESAREVSRVLRSELARMEPEDRLILEMLYIQGHKVSVIARALALDQKALYRAIKKLQSRLRSSLEEKGITWEAVEPLLETPSGSFDIEELFRSRPSDHYGSGASSAPGGPTQ